MVEILGTTYSVSHYDTYKKTGNSHIFEEVIDKMMLDEIPGMDDKFKENISKMDSIKRRMAILSLLDRDRDMFMKIKSLIGDSGISIMSHLEEVIRMLREYVKVGEVERKKFGEVMTPLELVKEMLSTLPAEVWSNPNLKWLDSCNGTGPFLTMVIYKLMKGLEKWEPDEEKRYKHIIENMIYTGELQPKNMFLYMCAVNPHDKFKLNVYTGSFLDSGFDNHMKDVWKVDKFDIVVGNPPYNQMIDMDFLCKCHDISDIILYVHPSTWLLDEKGKQRKFINTKDKVGEDLISIKLFNGNKIFGIQLFVPCAITYFNKNLKHNGIKCIDKINNKELIYENIYQINKFSNNDIYPLLKNKIISKCEYSLYDRLREQEDLKYFVNLSQIRGHVDLKSESSLLKDDFYSNLKRLYDHYAGMFPTFDSFRLVFKELTSNFGSMVIVNRGACDNFLDKIFWYRAQNDSVGMIGCNQFINHHNNNYDNEWKKKKRGLDIMDIVNKKGKTKTPEFKIDKIGYKK